jgi:hypothetical protein
LFDRAEAVEIGSIFSSSCLKEGLEYDEHALVWTGDQELFGIPAEASGKALDILSRVGAYLAFSENGLDGVEAFDGGRLDQQGHLNPSKSKAIFGFKTFGYVLSKALVQATKEKLASCLVVFPIVLVKLDSETAMAIVVVIALSRVNLACSLTTSPTFQYTYTGQLGGR